MCVCRAPISKHFKRVCGIVNHRRLLPYVMMNDQELSDCVCNPMHHCKVGKPFDAGFILEAVSDL